MRAIETRQKQIADGLAAGEQGRQSLANAEKRDRRHDGRGQDHARRRSSRRARSSRPRRSSRRRSRPRPKADRIVAAAKAEIEQEVARAKEALRDQVADLAVAGAAKILKREVDAKAHADLLAAIRQAALGEARMAELTTIARPYAEAAFRARARRATRCRRGRRCCASRARSSPTRASRAALDNPKLDARRQGVAAAVDLRRQARRRRAATSCACWSKPIASRCCRRSRRCSRR